MTATTEPVGPIPRQRALIPGPARLPAVHRWSFLPAIARWRGLPAVTRTAGAVAVGLALEYALRSVANNAVARVSAPVTPRQPAARSSTGAVRRTIFTEVVVIERYRRRG